MTWKAKMYMRTLELAARTHDKDWLISRTLQVLLEALANPYPERIKGHYYSRFPIARLSYGRAHIAPHTRTGAGGYGHTFGH